MENLTAIINTLPQARNAVATQSTTSESLTPIELEKRSSYLAQVRAALQHLHRLRVLHSDDVLDLDTSAKAWAKALFGTVPEADLMPTAERVAADRTGDEFPVNMPTFRDAWKRLDAERREAAQRRIDEAATAEREAHFKAEREHRVESTTAIKLDNYYRECIMCLNSGWAFTTRTYLGRTYKGVIRCQSCAYWQKRAVTQ